MKHLQLFENFSNKILIVVDIQPEYENAFTFKEDFFDFINNSNYKEIVFLYNGENTVGEMSEEEYIQWLSNYGEGINEDVLYDITFYDKGYNFFRNCMDEGIDDDSIIRLIKYMYKNDINDTRDIDEDMWVDVIEMFKDEHDMNEIKELMAFSENCLFIPELMDFLKTYEHNNIDICGGGIDECLHEVKLVLDSLDMDYNNIDKFIY